MKFSEITEGMFSNYGHFFNQKVSAAATQVPNFQEKQYVMYVSVWNYNQRGVTITIMKGNKTVWENKSNNYHSLDADMVKANHMLKSIGLNPENVQTIKKLNGKVIEDSYESVELEGEELEEARRAGNFSNVAPDKRYGLKVGDTKDLGDKFEIILPRNDLDKRKELLTPLINKGYKIVNVVKNMKMDIMTLKKPLNEEVENLDEYVMDYQQRRKRGMVMKRFKTKIKMARERKAKRLATNDQLIIRARRTAIKILRRKLAGRIGMDYANLSVSQKMQIDAKVQKKSKLIKKIALKILPRVRKMEIERYKRKTSNSPEAVTKTPHIAISSTVA